MKGNSIPMQTYIQMYTMFLLCIYHTGAQTAAQCLNTWTCLLCDLFFYTSYFLLLTFTSYFLPGYYYSHCYTCIVTLVLLPLYFCHCSWSSALAYQYISLYIHMRRHNWFVKFLCRCIMIPEPKTKEAVVSVKFSVNFDVWLPPTNPKLTRAHQPRLEEQ